MNPGVNLIRAILEQSVSNKMVTIRKNNGQKKRKQK